MDTVHETIKERLAEIRELASGAKSDGDLRTQLMVELGSISEHISHLVEAWLVLEEEASDLLDLLTLFYQADEDDVTILTPATANIDAPFSNLLDPGAEDALADSLRKGMAFFDLWLFREAAETLALVVRMEPDNVIARLFLAASETARGRFAEALPILRELLTLQSDEMLRCAANEIAAQGYFANDNLNEAIACLQEVVGSMPDYPDSWYNLGVCFTHQRDHIGAIGALSQALSLSPDDVEARALLADVQAQISEYQMARDTLAEGLERHPLHAGLMVQMAQVLSKSDRLGESLRWYRRATQVNPENHAAWSGYAGMLLRMGRRDEAIAALKKHLCLRPNHSDGLAQLAVLKSIRGDEVSGRYLEMLEGQSHPSVLHLAQGRIALQQGQVKRALASFERALQSRAHPAVHRLAKHYQDTAQSKADDTK